MMRPARHNVVPSDARLRARIRRLVLHYQRAMGLSAFGLLVKFERIEADNGAYATCQATPEYLSAELTFDLERLKLVLHETTNEHLVEWVVRHELAHVGLWQGLKVSRVSVEGDSRMEKIVEDVNEHLATWVASMPAWKE